MMLIMFLMSFSGFGLGLNGVSRWKRRSKSGILDSITGSVRSLKAGTDFGAFWLP